MKVSYSIWISDRENYNATRELDSHDSAGISAAFDDILDLHELRAERSKREASNRESERRLGILMELNTPEPARDDGPHARVFEYDGAYQCLNCGGQWGALSGKPVMPVVCSRTVNSSGKGHWDHDGNYCERTDCPPSHRGPFPGVQNAV